MARSRAGCARSNLSAATASMSPFTCSAVITSGKLWGALGVRTRRAGFMGIRPSRERKRNSERTAASLRRMDTALSCRLYRSASHSRISSTPNWARGGLAVRGVGPHLDPGGVRHEQDVGAAQGEDAGDFGKVVVVTDDDADLARS